jgi:hypothetical protein
MTLSPLLKDSAESAAERARSLGRNGGLGSTPTTRANDDWMRRRSLARRRRFRQGTATTEAHLIEGVEEALDRSDIEDDILAAGLFFPRDARSGLPSRTIVGVSAAAVYGFDSHRERGWEPTDLVFAHSRVDLDVKVHQRPNVQVIELIDRTTGTKVELEGSRIPGIHAKDVIAALRGA